MNPLFFLYILWIWVMGLGQRTYHVNGELSIHPLQLIMATIVVLIPFGMISSGRRVVTWHIPWLYAFAVFWLYGLVLGSLYGISLFKMLELVFNFLPLLLMPYMLANMSCHERFWQSSVKSFFWMGSVLAFIGILEYWFPSLMRFLPATDTVYIGVDQYGFVRAGYLFWGGPTATFVVALSLPFATNVISSARGVKRAMVLVGASVSLVGIYIGGYRSVWLLTIVLITALLVLRYRKKGLLLSLTILVTAYLIAPETGKIRLYTVKSIYTQEFTDTSLEKRSDRALGGIKLIQKRPWGSGFSAAGWTHNDFLQIGSDLGVPAMVLFTAWYLSRLMRLLRAVRWRQNDSLLVSLTGGFLAMGGLLLVEGMTVSSWLAIPCWFVWILGELKLREMKAAKRTLGISTIPRSYAHKRVAGRFIMQ